MKTQWQDVSKTCIQEGPATALSSQENHTTFLENDNLFFTALEPQFERGFALTHPSVSLIVAPFYPADLYPAPDMGRATLYQSESFA